MADAWKDYAGWIGKYVRVVQIDGDEIDGVLYCIDPETKNVIVLRQDSAANTYFASVVLSHALRHIQGTCQRASPHSHSPREFVVHVPALPPIFCPFPRQHLPFATVLDRDKTHTVHDLDSRVHVSESGENTASSKRIEERKSAILELLTKHRLPACYQKETRTIGILEGLVSIRAPFRPSDCTGTNTSVLIQVRKLIEGIVSI